MESATKDETFEDVAALDVVPERPLMQFQLSRPADSIGEPRVFADFSADNEMFTGSRSTKIRTSRSKRKEMSVSVQACKVKKDTGSQTWTQPVRASTQYPHPVRCLSVTTAARSMAWRCMFLIARRGQHGRVMVRKELWKRTLDTLS